MGERRKPVTLPNNLRGVVAKNLQTLMDDHETLHSQPAVAKASGMDQTTVGRILRAEMALTVDKIDGLARAFKLQPWQLMVPNIQPGSPPELATIPVEQFKQTMVKFFDVVVDAALKPNIAAPSTEFNKNENSAHQGNVPKMSDQEKNNGGRGAQGYSSSAKRTRNR